MVNVCCVKRCRSESYAGCGISFHKFPKDEKIRRKWLELIPAKNLKYAAVCSLHFKRDDFVTACSRQMLKADAVPSVFADESRLNEIWVDPNATPSRSPSPGTSQDPSMVFSQETDSTSYHFPAERAVLKDVAVQTGPYGSPAEANLRQKVKVLQQRLNRRTDKIERLKSKSHKSSVSDPTYIVYVSK